MVRRFEDQSYSAPVVPFPAGRAPRTMIAARVHRPGPPSVIAMERIEVPRPARDEVLVRVYATGVGPWDASIRSGKTGLHQPLPVTLGSDISGVVESVGENVSAFQPGDAVFGVTNQRLIGGCAEYAVASTAMIARKPNTLSHIEASSAPVVAVTAWQMLFDCVAVRSGQTVFVHGGASNVGGYVVQLARLSGVRAIASALEGDTEYVRLLGASEVVDAKQSRSRSLARCADAVIDTVGGRSQERLFPLVRPGGIVVSCVSRPDARLARWHGLRSCLFTVNVTSAVLARVAGLFEARELITSVGTILPLAKARMAHEILEGRDASPYGKIVLDAVAA